MFRIGAVVGLGKFRLPLLLGIFSGEGGNFIIKDRNSRVGGLFFLRRSRSWIRGLAAGGREGS